MAKFKENPQGLRILANELVAGEIAALLELPCAEVAILEIGPEFLEVNAPLRDQYTPKLTSGNHFGIVEVKNKWRSPVRPLISTVANKEDFPPIVVFDAWTLNTDRNNDGNYLIVRPEFAPNRRYFSPIDHGMCFTGPQWNASIINQVDSRNFSIIPELACEIHGADPFSGSLTRAEGISDLQLRAIVESIPDEWQVSLEERDALLGFLIARKAKLPEILLGVRGQFPFWTG